jgi:hypothetical protein
MSGEYFISFFIWLMLVWLLWMAVLSIKTHTFQLPGFINVFLTCTLVHAVCWLLGFKSSAVLPYDFYAARMSNNSVTWTDIFAAFSADMFLSWAFMLVSLFLIALRIKR